jgi:hypothetical protein
MKTLTSNTTANYIAKRGFAKWVHRNQAVAIWNNLKSEGWRAEGLTLVKVEGGEENRFHFEKHGTRVTIHHCVMEVAQ